MRKGINNKTFAITTLLAVIAAIGLIMLARVSIPTSNLASANSILDSTSPTSAPDSSGIPSLVENVPGTSKGIPDAPINIVEFSDFQCFSCQNFAVTIEKQLEAAYIDTGKVRLIYKFMVGFGEESRRADEAAAAAAEQGQFWPYYYLLMQLRASSKIDDLSVEKLQGLAQQSGLNMEVFNKSFLSHKFADLVNKDDAEGRALGVSGTPIFFINGIKMNGAASLADFQNIIEPILQKSANQGKPK